MKIIVFGATGNIGRLATDALLAAGHDVTAFARHPETLAPHECLTLHAGDALDPDSVQAAVSGFDACVITLGSGKSRKSMIRSAGTLNVINAMQARGMRRLICQSTLGAHESWGNLNFFWKRIMFGALLRPVFLDHELQEHLVRASGLDWTIVRPSAFRDGPATGNYIQDVAPEARRLKLTITRTDVAAFLARQVSETRYLGRAVGISA